MKCSSAISHRPYVPYNRAEDAKKPYICRIVPHKNGFAFEWLDNFSDKKEHTLYVSERGKNTWTEYAVTGSVFTVTGLAENTEYEFKLRSQSGIESNTRLVFTGEDPDGVTVVNYLHPDDKQYAFSGNCLCSPSLVRLPSGALVAGMDVFGRGDGQNLVILFRSEDDGKSWRYLCDLYPFFWTSLFVHGGKLYAFGLSTEYGNLQISVSEDGGKSFSNPTVLIYGASSLCKNGGPHRAPMHVVHHKGRIYTSCEYGSWGMGIHSPGILSIDENADLMCAENWHISGFLPYDGRWKEETVEHGDCMEGNITVLPDGKLCNILRCKVGKALKLRINTEDPDSLPEYVCEIPLPVTRSMFRILPYKNGYLLVTNHKTDATAKNGGVTFRNVLSVFYSEDFENWTFLKDIVNRENDCDTKVGFQYPCVVLEGDTLYVEIRAAYNNAQSFHDTNYAVFKKVTLEKDELVKIGL